MFMKQNTSQLILDVARSIVRNRGYSAFSYADIAKEVGIRKASIHYHFPAKDDLVKELVKDYRQTLVVKLREIEKGELTPQEQLQEFVNLYRDGLQNEQICLCGMLSADFSVLSVDVKKELQLYLEVTQAWLSKLLHRGIEEQVWQCSQPLELEAKTMIAILQGTQLLARISEDSIATFDSITRGLLKNKFNFDYHNAKSFVVET